MTNRTQRLHDRMEHDREVLQAKLQRMGELVLGALEDATAAVASRDRKLAYQVVLLDNRIDVLEGSIDRLCQEFLVRHMPAAGLLRFVLAAGKVNSELERIGDYAEAIARRAITLSGYGEIPEKERIFEMARIAIQALRQAVQSFLAGNAEQAAPTFGLDSKVDEMNSTIFRALAHPGVQEQDLTARFALLGLVNRLERVADRACNIAEETIYVVRGQVLRHMPRHDIRVLFLCEHNHCRSQMAEAIARQFAPANFVFQSAAGLEPQPVDPAAVQFMARQGLDLSRQRPKVLADVGEVGDFNVVVTLSQGGETACPALPYSAIALNWEIEDPSRATGAPEEKAAAYERVYHDLRAKIAELAEGMLGAQAEREARE